MMPTLEVYNHQQDEIISEDSLAKLTQYGNLAIPMVELNPANGGGVLAHLEEVEISIVSNEVISQVHEDFMDIPGATDVITFGHGEIVISAQVAREYSVRFGNSFEKELMLYIVHGLLHLAGHEDTEPTEREMMESVQSEILSKIWID